MSNDAGKADKAAADQDSADAQKSLGAADSDLAAYMDNVNSRLSAGNPYESKDYLENQNLQTSGAMNAEKGATDEALGSTVARTGTNSAALAGTIAEAGRQGARDLTQYTAGRDTANEDKWLNEEDALTRDQLAGAQEEGSLYNTALGGQNSTLGSYTQAQAAQDAMWSSMVGAAATGAGVGAGIAMH